jgi:hypothetical protein
VKDNNAAADSGFFLGGAEPENWGVFPHFRFFKFAVGANKNAAKVYGGGKANGIRKGLEGRGASPAQPGMER